MSNPTRMTFGKNFVHVHQLTDFGFDTHHNFKMSPDTPFHADKCCCLVHAHTAQRLQHAYAAVPASSCSIVHLYLLICICMLLFFWMLLVRAMTAYLCVLITFVKFVITVTFHHHSNVLPWLSLFCSLIASFSRLLY